jgi:hypothetical protein
MSDLESEVSLKTILNILAPKEINVALVPLNQVNDIETSFFWSSIFLSISSTILGAILSLFTTDYNNDPVLYVLLLFFLIFLIFTISFSVKGFKQRMKARKGSLKRSSETELDDSITPNNYKENIYIGLLFKLMYLIREKIFLSKNPRKAEVVKEIWLEIFGEDPSYKIFNALIRAGLFERIEDDDGTFLIKFNSDFDPETFTGKDLI